METGQKVICISDNFPWIEKYGGTPGQAASTPYIGEILQVDEVLGEFLRFDKYDTEQSYNWWKSDRFRPFEESEEMLKVLEEKVGGKIVHIHLK